MATRCLPLLVPLRAADHTPGTSRPSTARGAVARAAPAAPSGRRYPFFSPAPPPQDQERVRQQNEGHMVLPAPPGPALEVVQAQLVFQFLVTVLHPPAPFRRPNQPQQRRDRRQVAEEILRRLRLAFRPLHHQ